MNVHLLCSKDYDKAAFAEVVQFLTSYEGPIHFYPSEPLEEEEDLEAITQQVSRKDFYIQQRAAYNRLMDIIPEPRERLVTSWEELFATCERYRIRQALPDTDMIILLTPYANDKNWFAAMDPEYRYNGFVHTGEWKHYVKCPETFPVAYLVASHVLRSLMFETIQEGMAAVHQSPLGCFNDFCGHKKEIILKLRTADVCYDCMMQLKDKAETLLIQQVLNIFEGVRLRILFAQNFRQNAAPSKLIITNQNRLFLSDYGNIEIRLTPLEKTLYLFFLRYPGGVMLHDLVDHQKELRLIYGLVTNSGSLGEIGLRIMQMTDVTTNSASEKISKIKSVFTKAIGKDLAEHYIIKGGNGQPKKIDLDRALVSQP